MSRSKLIQFVLQFAEQDIMSISQKYSYLKSENEIALIGRNIKERGFAKRDEFLSICEWKSSRPRAHLSKNSSALIEDATTIALTTPHEELRIGVLTLLNGVSMPMASAFLHFCHKDPYPILDFRALESLGNSVPAVCSFDFWWEYTLHCRALAQRNRVSMRTLDKALWEWSKAKSTQS